MLSATPPAAGSETEKPPYQFRIDVETQYLGDQSEPLEERYVFAYTVTIRNEGRAPAQLLGRHWVVTDANGKVEEVRGDGVVGEQPRLEPGQSFRYSSAAILQTPVGSMEGSYFMIGEDGERFEAPIAAFTLAMPGMLH